MDKSYKPFAINLAKRAGLIIKDNFSLNMKREHKNNGSFLTETDKTINRLLVSEIKANYPNHGIITEEGDEEKRNSEIAWVCDPIDGTTAFSHGIPFSVISIALVENGVSILGVVYDPYMDRLFSAEKNNGAYLNNNIITVSKTVNFSEGVFNIEPKPHSAFNLYQVADHLSRTKARILKLNSTVYQGILVALGESSAMLFAGKSPWDAAAVKIIVEEAGGKVTNLAGNEQRYDGPINGIIASNGYMHDELVSIVGKYKQ
ncbi:MAG: inositol monophosphatase [bacterium]